MRTGYLSERVADIAELMSAVMQAREIILLAFGENKMSTVAKAVEGPVSPSVPASFLQEHPNAIFYLDDASCAGSSPGLQAALAASSCLLIKGAMHVCRPHAPAVSLTAGNEGALMKQGTHLNCLDLSSLSTCLQLHAYCAADGHLTESQFSATCPQAPGPTSEDTKCVT